MAKFFFAAQPGMGHLNPLLTMALRMRARGHEAVFLATGPKRIAETIAGHGFPTVTVRPPLVSLGLAFLPWFSGYWETWVAMRLFTAGSTGFTRSLRPELRALRPDVVVADFALPAASLAAEAEGIPAVTVYHAGLAYRGPGIPPFGSGLPIGGSWGADGERFTRHAARLERTIAAGLARARTDAGLPPAEPRPYFWTSRHCTLVLTAQQAEAPRDPLPPRSFYIGPCFGERRAGAAQGFPFERLSDSLRKVYVSLGTVFNDKPEVFRRLIAALAGGGRQLVISAGGAYRSLHADPLPADVLLFERVPQVDVLPRMDAVVSHGGNNTVNETLAAGRPLLVLPVGGEQGDNASRVVHLGAGLRLDLRRFTEDEARGAMERLLAEPSFRARAGEVAEILGRTDGPATAARFLERLVETRAPIERPPGYPQTVTRDLPMPWEMAASPSPA